VNEGDPTGLYEYHYLWALGWLTNPQVMFNYFINNAEKVFPFSTGRCKQFYIHEDCNFDPPYQFGIANLRVSYLGPITADLAAEDHVPEEAGMGYMMTLTILNWCQSGFLGLFCIAGDLPGGHINFMLYTLPQSYLESIGEHVPCVANNGPESIVEQSAPAPAGPITNRMAPMAAFSVWKKMGQNLIRDYGQDPGQLAFLGKLSSAP
jgi:hypothetical protein